MKLKLNNRKNGFFVLIPLIMMTFLLAGCTKDESIEFNDYTHAVFVRNNNIYLYKNSDDYLTIIGDLSKVKDLVALNEDNKLLAFSYADITEEIELYDINNNSYRQLKLENPEGYYVSGLKWKEDKLAVSLYVDRNTSKTLIYDINSNELINSCDGIFIGILDDGNGIVYGKNTDGLTSIYVDDSKVYTLERQGEIIQDGTVGHNKIGFMTFYFDRSNGKQQHFIYEGEFKDKELKKINCIEQPGGVNGNLVFTKNSSYINTMGGTYKLDKGKLVLNDDDNEKKSIEENLNNLRDIFRKTFVSEKIDENTPYDNLGIENIIWFSK